MDVERAARLSKLFQITHAEIIEYSFPYVNTSTFTP